MSIQKNIKEINNQLIGTQAKLIAVSKTKPVEMLMEAYKGGCKRFGENYVQELVDKQATMPSDIEWHFIGHLQTNKVRYIAPFVSLIHSVDSFKLLFEIDKQAGKNKRVINCLLQLHIAQEDTKTGMTETELVAILNSEALSNLQNIKVIGLMGMSTFTDDMAVVRQEFKTLKDIFDRVKHIEKDNCKLTEISMGMSGDWKIAIEEGSTMIRVGSAIFGERA